MLSCPLSMTMHFINRPATLRCSMKSRMKDKGGVFIAIWLRKRFPNHIFSQEHITCTFKETQPLNSRVLTLLFELELNPSVRLRLNVGLKRHRHALFPTVSVVKVCFPPQACPALFSRIQTSPHGFPTLPLHLRRPVKGL